MSELREIVFHDKDIRTFQRMVAIAYFHNIPKEGAIVDKIIEHCEKAFAFNYFATKNEHIILVRWMRVVWAHYPDDDFKELINEVAKLRIDFPEAENPAPDKERKYLIPLLPLRQNWLRSVPNGEYEECSDFEELVTE